MERVGGKGVGKKGRKCSPSPPLSFFWLSFHFSRGQNRESRPRSFFAPKQHGNACYGYAGYYLALTLAYKSISILSGARSASGRLFMFSAVKANERARAFALGPRGGGDSHTLPIRVCAAQRGRDFEAPYLEQGIHFRGVFYNGV